MTEKIKDITIGDILTFIADDDNYKALICTSTDKKTSPHSYTFAATTINSKIKPGLEDILASSFYGKGNRRNDFYKFTEDEINQMWTIHPETKPYHLGSYGLTIWRKDFMKFRDQFEKIGNINIVKNIDLNGSGGMNASSINLLKQRFASDFEQFMENQNQQKYAIKAIVARQY